MGMRVPLADTLPANHVRVDFGAGIPGEFQGPALMLLEKFLRIECGTKAQVFKAEMADDLKRRRDMTEADRRRL